MTNQDEVRDWEEELENKFEDMLNLVEVQTGESERENLKSFVRTLLAKKREACESVSRYYGNPKAKEMVYLEDVIKILS